MKKLLAVLLTFLLVCTFSLSAFAASEEIYTYEIGNVTVIFDENDALDAATREALAHMLASGSYGEQDIATYNLLCTLFGHKTQTSGATTVTHCAQASQPRCLEECFAVTTCTRCDYTSVERTGYRYITCCP